MVAGGLKYCMFWCFVNAATSLASWMVVEVDQKSFYLKITFTGSNLMDSLGKEFVEICELWGVGGGREVVVVG